MIDAFKSTLEESLAADLVLLLIDASEKIEDIRIKYASCWDVLDDLKVDKSKVFVILSKCDSIQVPEKIERNCKGFKDIKSNSYIIQDRIWNS